MRVALCLNKLDINVRAIARLLHTAFQDIGDAQLARDFEQINRGASLTSCGGARDDSQPTNFRERGNDFVLNSLRKKGIFFVGAQILEWQDGDRFALDGGSGSCGSRFGGNSKRRRSIGRGIRLCVLTGKEPYRSG